MVGIVGVSVILAHPLPKYPYQDLIYSIKSAAQISLYFSCKVSSFLDVGTGDDPLLSRGLCHLPLHISKTHTQVIYTHMLRQEGVRFFSYFGLLAYQISLC